jgi:DNA replication protein DnaC
MGPAAPEHHPDRTNGNRENLSLLEKACRQGYTAYYARAPKFFRKLAVAYADGSFDKFLTQLARTDVLGVDDWGLVPLSDSERRHCLEVIEDRHGSRSTVLTSQFPVDTWHDLIGNPSIADATTDRIIHKAHRIALQGESLRRAEAEAKKAGASDQNPPGNPASGHPPSRQGRREVGV